jgi:predicted nucleotidyltransferase
MIPKNEKLKDKFTLEQKFEEIKNKYDQARNIFEPELIHHKSVIVEEIIKATPLASVYLTGSFARNEGSLKFEKGQVTPLRDYDILVVSNDLLNQDVIDKIRIQIHSKLGLSDPFSRDFKFGGFTVWITQTSIKSINAFPLLKYYELKHSSILLWGKDIREEIKINFEDLSYYNGVLILFSKVEGLLGLIKLENLRDKNSIENLDDVLYECLKAYVEIGTCLSFIIHKYETSFLRRSLNISQDFGTLFPELTQLSPDLPSRIVASSYQRLMVGNSFIENLNLGLFIRDTMYDLKAAIWFYLQRTYQTNITYSNDYSIIFDKYLDKLNSRILDELFSFYLKNKLGFCPKSLRRLVVSSYLRYCSLKFLFVCRKSGYPVKMRVLLYRNSNLMLRLWLTGILLLDSISDDLIISDSSLKIAERRLSEVLNLDYSNGSVSEDKDSRFIYLKETESKLLDIADRIFHRKS